jgi:hypothetical protein
MAMPENWRSLDGEPVFVNDELIGNHKYGDSVAIHSVAISPEYQGKKVGRALVRAYLEHLGRGCFGASKVVLIAHDYLVKFYESVGFKNQGKSQSNFAGGVWFDMVCLYPVPINDRPVLIYVTRHLIWNDLNFWFDFSHCDHIIQGPSLHRHQGGIQNKDSVKDKYRILCDAFSSKPILAHNIFCECQNRNYSSSPRYSVNRPHQSVLD